MFKTMKSPVRVSATVIINNYLSAVHICTICSVKYNSGFLLSVLWIGIELMPLRIPIWILDCLQNNGDSHADPTPSFTHVAK
jgi:hypothetical protein